ncbi:MAG: folylpolyglutamate synthase/dihydrofolate synthase family protein [Elusimicrobiota bacterium]
MSSDSLKRKLEFLYSLYSRGIKLGLRNVADFLKKLKNPQNYFPAIHIAGTNGKGSVSHMIAATLMHAGYRVGLYTSPHLLRFNERIRVNNKMISDSDIMEFTEKNWNYIKGQKVTFFEVTTAMAFEFFRKKRVDIAVLETGMGGRLDATRLCNPILTIITHIGLDHLEYLGRTLKQVAREKLGVVRRGIPLVIGNIPQEAISTIKMSCRKNGVPILFSRAIKIKEIGVQPPFQIINKKTVLKAIKYLKNVGFNILDKHIEKGLNTLPPCRFMKLGRKPVIITDVSHNPDGFAELNKSLKKFYKGRRIIFIIGIMKDKNIPSMARKLPGKGNVYIITKPNVERAAEPEYIASFFDPSLKVFTVSDIRKALRKARALAGRDDIICICGSFYTVGEALRILKVKVT